MEAQKTGISSITEGITGGQIDQIVRSKIEEISPGFSKYFITGLGHGVGLDIHEYPMLIPNSSDKIYQNSVFTIEPGVYLPEWGGIRIEDMVLFKDNQVSVLTKSKNKSEQLMSVGYSDLKKVCQLKWMVNHIQLLSMKEVKCNKELQ